MEETLMLRCSGLISLVFMCVLSSCIPVQTIPTAVGPTVTYNPFATLSPTPFGPEVSLPTSSPSLVFPTNTPIGTLTAESQDSGRARYLLNAVLDYHARNLSVDEIIVYQNNTGEALTQLVLVVEPNHWKDCFFLDTVQTNTGNVFYSLSGHRLEIMLATPLLPGADLTLTLAYRLELPESDLYHLFGYKTNQVNLIDWYPFVAPYTDDWLLHEPSQVGEHLVYENVDFDIRLEVIPLMVIAASAPQVDGRYHLENGRTFAFSVSPDLEAASESHDGITLTSYYFESEKNSGETILRETGAAITTFESLFSEYIHPSLSVVEADFFDGMEYDGLFFLGRNFYIANDGTKLNFMVDLAVHETAHQWWFGMVGNDQALEPWLDEALSTYSEYLFYEQNYPGIAESWWQFRINAFSPLGYVDSDIYSTNEFQTYAGGAYLRGAQFLRELRASIGDDAFFLFLKDYALQMTGKISTKDDFFRILRQHTSLDITEIRNNYFKP